ncbi:MULTISPECIES: tripartite tricarboxylate transporter TctB family protein [Fusobacterium]|uniref:tripartite tricarboxylate transporter TctB family protein n=1 Tax=Fusobacterium TaxID=848 RepID=UPI0014777F09|nr:MULTISPECIES: tripartite tricarboxylate transporter TctB family protein [Fusobacterium]NME36370.1 tripartite tricarboxylate transporter TctB family protein [Fusobacterium sp. FSA-380-WT-3A]
MTGVIALVLGIVYLIALYHIPTAAIGSPYAPIYFPAMLGSGMVILGILQLIKDKKIKVNQYTSDKTFPLIIKTGIIIIIYALLFDLIGYVISTMIFMFMMLYLFNGREKLVRSVIVSVLFSILIYVAFSKLLGIYLPVMPFLYI